MNTHTHNLAAELRRDALARELRIATKILNRDVADLKIVKYGPAPAWTDFADITLNAAMLPAVEGAEGVAVWVGAAMHELGHTLFTPRPGSALHARLTAASRAHPGVFRTLNILEDQRQERAIISRFAPMRGYLTAAIVHLILGAEGDPVTAWPLIAGRTWIAADARAAVRRSWRDAFGEASAATVARLIGEYQNLADPGERDALAAAKIVIAFDQLLADAAGEMGGCGAPSSHAGEPIDTPETDAPTAADADAEIAEMGEEGEEGEGAEDDAEGEGEDDAEGEGEGEGDAEGAEGEDDAEGEGEGDAEGAEGAEGEGDAEGEDDTAGDVEGEGEDDADADALADALRDAVAEVLAAPDVARELGEIADAVQIDIAPERRRADTSAAFPADADAIRVRDALGETLRELRADAEGGWVRGVNSGRVNVRRYSAPTFDPDTLFDRYTPDALADVSVAAAVLVDLSGSMGSHARDLSRAVWAIRHAADDAEVDLRVIGFGSETRTLATGEDRPTSAIPALACSDGSTLPLTAVEDAYRFLRGSDAATRLFVILSDGSWEGDVARADGIIRLMGEEGAETITIGFGAAANLGAHGARTFAPMTDLAALPILFAEVVERAMMIGARM